MTIEYHKAEYGDFDIEAVVEIALAIRPDAFESVANNIEWHDAQRAAGRMCVRWLVSVDGRIGGSASAGQRWWLAPEVVALYVAVHPDLQHRGYGRELLRRAEATAGERGGGVAYSWTDETQPRSISFLERAGYREADRGWESTLDLTDCDPDDLRDTVARVTSNGVRIVSVAKLASERNDWKRQLHQLYADLHGEVPGPFPFKDLPFEDFEAQSLGHRFVGDGFFVALDGDRLVGLTEPQLVDDAPRQIWQNLTGVRPSHRRRGIATALKSQAAMWAIDNGYTTIRTHSAQSNASMIGINERFGFKRSRATLVYLKDL